MSETALTYLKRGERGIFIEVYFPRRVAVQGTIFDALEDGHNEEIVKEYIQRNVDALMQELPRHLRVFDSKWYDIPKSRKKKLTKKNALTRIESYISPFFGWSNYVVDGVFFGEDGKMIEEPTQIIRLMFRFESSYLSKAIELQCQDVLRTMLFWIISRQARLNEVSPWHPAEKKRFIREYEPFTKQKREFVEKFFEPVAREVFKWEGDCFLFIFGFLVRRFSEELVRRGRQEEEIWVASFFNLTVFVMKKTI